MKNIVIYGCGGLGMETAQLIEDINKVNKQWNILGFIDDCDYNVGRDVMGYKILGGQEYIIENKIEKDKMLMIGDESGKEGQFSDRDKKTAENYCIDYMDVE